MLSAIVPVYNEESRVGRLLGRLLSLEAIDKIFVILNGSNISTEEEVKVIYEKNKDRIVLVSFVQPLGIDVPRAVGARLAFSHCADYALFVDGDLVGEITRELTDFISNTKDLRLDLALMDCYPQMQVSDTLDEPMFYFRRLLNQSLGVYGKVGIATPSHGPHIVSRRLLAAVPWQDFCVPPTIMVHAVRLKMNMNTAGSVPHILLGSSLKNNTHSRMIVDTIAGDSLEALCMIKNIPRERTHLGKVYLGYHHSRRMDLLLEFLAGKLC